MTTLLTFRENIKAFFCRYDYIIIPVLKLILAFVLFFTLNSGFGYMPLLNKMGILFLLGHEV